MKKIVMVFLALAMTGLMGMRVYAVTDSELVEAATDPELLKSLLAGKTLEEAIVIAAAVMKVAVVFDGTEAELSKRIAVVTAAVMSGVKPESREAVAVALVKAAGRDHMVLVVASISLALGNSKEAPYVVKAAVAAADSEKRKVAAAAAKYAAKTLGNLAPVVVATVTGGKEPPVPPEGEKYEGQ